MVAMGTRRDRTPEELERELLTLLNKNGREELAALAGELWGRGDDDLMQARAALEDLEERGLVHAEHLYPSQLLFQRIDPKSPEGRKRGSRSFYTALSEAKASQ